MIMKDVIGIVGQGFVGNAVKQGFKDNFTIATYDTDEAKPSTCNSLFDLVDKAVGGSNGSSGTPAGRGTGIIFVCVPTPMKKDGSCDTSIVEDVLFLIDSLVSRSTPPTLPIVILKSTVPPSTCDRLSKAYRNIALVFNPEFLTEANAVEDFRNQEVIHFGINTVHETIPDFEYLGRILDGMTGAFDSSDAIRYDLKVMEATAVRKIVEVFSKQFPNAKFTFNTYTEAEMLKYVANCFLALKVVFANQIYNLCKELPNTNYNQVTDLVKMDSRLGETHWKVPGPDGDLGYGGHCFPKDMAALSYLAETMKVDLSLIKTAIYYNDSIRTNRNWEAMVGRAVSAKE